MPSCPTRTTREGRGWWARSPSRRSWVTRTGAHKIVADLFQALNDIGFSVAAQGCTYWNGEAMQGTDYTDLDDVPDAIASATRNAARNAVHLAAVLRQNPYPANE